MFSSGSASSSGSSKYHSDEDISEAFIDPINVNRRDHDFAAARRKELEYIRDNSSHFGSKITRDMIQKLREEIQVLKKQIPQSAESKKCI